MEFSLAITDWNWVAEVGLPPDGTWCFVAFGDDKTGYDWSMGGYSTETGNFWGSMGYGGMVLNGEKCIAWKSWNNVNFFVQKKDGEQDA